MTPETITTILAIITIAVLIHGWKLEHSSEEKDLQFRKLQKNFESKSRKADVYKIDSAILNDNMILYVSVLVNALQKHRGLPFLEYANGEPLKLNDYVSYYNSNNIEEKGIICLNMDYDGNIQDTPFCVLPVCKDYPPNDTQHRQLNTLSLSRLTLIEHSDNAYEKLMGKEQQKK